MRGEWSGDIDLNDGQLQQMFEQYQSRLQFISAIGLDERRDHGLILTDLKQENQSLENDLEFLAASMCVYVCVCVAGLLCAYVLVHVCVFVYGCVCLCVGMCGHVVVCVCVTVCVHFCVYLHVYVCAIIVVLLPINRVGQS